MTKTGSPVVDEDFINELIENDEQMLAISKKERLSPVIQIVETFLEKNKCVLYGGTAINMYLPKSNQFYTETDIPDYDAYTLNAKEKSFELAKELEKQKYDFILIKNAIHSGTFKLSWWFNDISDLTDVYDYEYSVIKKTAKRINNKLIASKNLLKCNSYLELSMPKSCLFRWAKVYKRLSLLLESETLEDKKIELSKIIDSCYSINLPSCVKHIIKDLNSYIRKNSLPVAGFEAIKYYLKVKNKSANHLMLHENSSILQVLSINMEQTKKDMIEILNHYTNEITYEVVRGRKSNFFPDKITLRIKIGKTYYKVISIIDASVNCYGIHEKKHKSAEDPFFYVSIFFVLYQLYFNLFTYETKNSAISEHLKKVAKLIQEKIMKKNVSTLCYGHNETLSAKKVKNSKMGKPIVIYSSEKKAVKK
jgi:hypothetical protein